MLQTRFPDGERAAEPRRAAGNQALHFRRNLVVAQIDVIRADGVRDGAKKLFLVDDLVVGQHLDQRFARVVDLGEEVVRLRALDEALVDEKVDDLLVGWWSWRGT